MSSSEEKPLEIQILQFTLHREFYGAINHILSEDMFEGLSKTIFRTILNCHEDGEFNLTKDEVHSRLLTANPALVKSTREDIADIFSKMADPPENINIEVQKKVVQEFWARDQARLIGEKAIDIYTGTSIDFTDIKSLLDKVVDTTIASGETYTEFNMDVLEMFEQKELGSDFPFELGLIKEKVDGLSRGNLGIIFARPETGKTTFCADLCASYLRAGHSVVYWANEEPAREIRMRIIQSYFRITQSDLLKDKHEYVRKTKEEILPNLTILEAVGTSIEELDRYCKLKKPDIVFADQLDKFRVAGDYARVDEKLRQVYLTAREIAKRNNLLFWAVSQASFEAENRMEINYSMMENSRTGKAAEADFIVGIGKTGEVTSDNFMRYLCVSKNKINGWHGTINANIDIHRGFYY